LSEKIELKNNGSREQTKQRAKKSRYIKGNVTRKGRVSKAFHAIVLENNEKQSYWKTTNNEKSNSRRQIL
jgi:hypothetical protein